jgi:hypothetical protein
MLRNSGKMTSIKRSGELFGNWKRTGNRSSVAIMLRRAKAGQPLALRRNGTLSEDFISRREHDLGYAWSAIDYGVPSKKIQNMRSSHFHKRSIVNARDNSG